MELVQGEDLGAAMQRAGRLPLATALRIGGEIASALDGAHRAGLVHRDIKPANVLIERASGRALLTDFGIAKSLVPGAAMATHTGMFLGTYRYSSPEQIRNLRSVEIDARADIYSLGVVLYEMTSGRKFLDGWSESQIVSEVGYRTDWQPPLPYDEQPPAELVELIERCLAPRREERLASASDVVLRLAALAATVPPATDEGLVASTAAHAATAAAARTPTAATVAPARATPAPRRAAATAARPALDRRVATPGARARGGVARRGRMLATVAAIATLLAVGVMLAPEELRTAIGLAPTGERAQIASVQPSEKIVVLGRTEPQWFSVSLGDVDAERPPRMKWYLNGNVVAENGTVWEYDPAVHLPLVAARGEVRFVLGSGNRSRQAHIWATQTAINDLSPVLQSASYKPGSTIHAAVGERIEIDVDAYDPDDSPLTFTWLVDGKRAGGNEPRLVIVVQRDARVGLSVSDGGATVSSAWTIVADGAPR
jgi:hypothetical protein